MPRKVKHQRQKQRQKQKQTQHVVVNVNTTRAKNRARPTRKQKTTPLPQYIPYPVPSLRGPEQMVTSQPSLAQLLDIVKELKAPVQDQPLVPPPIVIPPIPAMVDESKEEIGPHVIVQPDEPMMKPLGPIVSSASSASASSSSSEEKTSAHQWTEQELRALNIMRSTLPGGMTLRKLAKELGVAIPRGVTTKSEYIERILSHIRASQ